MNTRLRQLASVGVVLVLTAVGFFVTRALGESGARRDSSHRADIAATQVRDRIAQAASLVDGVRRFFVENAGSGVTTEQFTDIGSRWLGPVGLPAAAWVERVSTAERGSYERRTGHRIVVPTSSGGLARAGPRTTYLPATVVTRSPPMSVPGIDLGGASGLVAAIARPQTAYRVSATPLRKLADGTTGLFLVQSAQRLSRGVVEPGYVLLFVPASWLLAGAADDGAATPTTNPTLQITVGGGSAGNVRNAATASSTFAAAGQRFDVRVPRSGVHGAAAVLPWLVAGTGLLLAVLAGALGLIAARRAAAKAELDRLFTLTPDLVVVAGFDGYFKRVNPAFETHLGYTQLEARARPYIEFVHPDDREPTQSERSRLREGETTTAFENRYVCKDGSSRWIEWTATPVVKERLTYAVGRDVTERRQAEADLRDAEERNRELADEQAALRRVATLVARGAPQDELFAAVAEEVGRLGRDLAGVARYESDDTVTVLSTWAAEGEHPLVPGPWPLEGGDVASRISRTGRPVRIDDYHGVPGRIAAFVREELGIRSSVGIPIVVEGRLWGALFVHSKQTHQPLPEDTEARLANFTELVATAVANAENRAKLARLAEEQAALRRVATLVAEGVPPAQVFSALGEEVNSLLDAQNSAIARLDADGKVTIVGNCGTATDVLALGARLKPEPGWLLTAVIETGRSARKDDYDKATEGMAGVIRGLGIHSSVGAPIVVEGALWGVIIVGTLRERFPDDTGQRLEEFTELAATAVANAENRSELAASRARIVAAADETRRRIERDLHDGTQQRLVSLSLELRLAESTVSTELGDTRTTIGRVSGELNRVIDELREISRGIHPAILSEGGLGPALRTLARRSAIPVELGDVIEHRLPEPIEVAAYYVVSEALTNATKHAHAAHVYVEAAVRDSSLRLSIRDDGVGGAVPVGGSGLIGLRDRVEALGGSIEIDSPPGQGTHVRVRLPLELDLTPDESQEPLSARIPASR
ncbi:MAG: domain S-box [Actinomycetia bacterium]|nr:domain S-box [Actinomycetes bacterium]